MIDLPEKFSAGIRLAVLDMKKCAKSSRYKIEMGDWHHPTEYETSKGVKKVCEVCMGGAVMAKTLKINPNDRFSPDRLPESLEAKISAFDWLRRGKYNLAYEAYVGAVTPPIFNSDLPEFYTYDAYPAGFYKWCLAVADELEKIGE